MKLEELLKNVNVLSIIGKKDIEIKGIEINSKRVFKNCLFAAITGFKQDGHNFAAEAAEMGAAAILTEKVLELDGQTTQVLVKNCRQALPVVSRNYYGNPSGLLRLCGITGTNGKTTTVFLTDSIFKAAGFKTSFITTVKAEMAGRPMEFERTTPESNDLNRFFSASVLEGVDCACMEVSSHSIDLGRVDWLNFETLVFTNLTQDHLDYHKDMENYFEVKKRLFDPVLRHLYGGKYAAVNIDDPYGKKLAENTDLKLFTYSIRDKNASICPDNILSSIDGIKMDVIINPPAGSNLKPSEFSVNSNLCGFFNVYNILAAVSAACASGIDTPDIIKGVDAMQGVTGRFEKIKLDKNIYAIVDYAHTPDGLENVLKTAKSLLGPGSRLICVFGCGGDRDTKKRKIMGSISASLADFSLITSDNPRSEDPLSIIKMIEEGFKHHGKTVYSVEADRRKAISRALSMAGKNDIVLIAGKGHENYQEFDGRRIHFSDQEVVREWSGN